MAEETKEEFETRMDTLRREQNLPEGAVPETRPQATISPDPVHGSIHEKLVDADSNLVDEGTPAMDKAAYDRANSDEQAEKAAKESFGPERLYPGAHAYIENSRGKGKEHNGRAVAVNGVNEWASPEDELLAAAGTPNSRFAQVQSYDCSTRDGRAEHLVVDAKHLSTVRVEDFHRTQT